MAEWGQIFSALPVILDLQPHHCDVEPLTTCLWTPWRRSSGRVTWGSVYEKRKTLSRCWRCLGTINVRQGLNYLSWAQLQSWELNTILHDPALLFLKTRQTIRYNWVFLLLSLRWSLMKTGYCFTSFDLYSVILFFNFCTW